MRDQTLALLALSATLAHAATSSSSAPASSCSSTLSSNATPSLAPGYIARLVANNLETPRGIKFDSAGNLLVVESGKGITALKIHDDGDGCLSSPSRETVISDELLNHGLELSEDGKTLYASSTEAAYSWEYDAAKQRNTSAPQTLVTNMTNTDHTTRTLLLSKAVPGMLLVSRGSTSNIDPLAADISTGHSQIKAFNLKNMTNPYDFEADGLLLGWGLRNDVGMAEDPVTGGIYSVENSVDEMHRNGKDIHQTNPAEELNFFGPLSSPSGRNYGYPECYTAWDPTSIPDFSGAVGEQFAIGNVNGSSDKLCSEANRQAPRLAFHPHMAPLDILFNDAGTAAWVTFHGSWNSDPPVGYKLSMIHFSGGSPTAPSTSKTAAIDILSNADTAGCSGDNCFRPVGLAWDAEGRLFMSSDETGEVYAILKADGTKTSGNATGTGTGSGPSASASGNVGMRKAWSGLAVAGGLLAWLM